MHASIVRRTETGCEYLELQDAKENGWEKLNDSVLKERFGCYTKNQNEIPNFLIDIETLGKSKEFIDPGSIGKR